MPAEVGARVTANEYGVSFWNTGSGDSGNGCTTL